MQDGEELEWMACDGASGVASGWWHRTECQGATAAAAAAATATGRWGCGGVVSLPWLPALQLDRFWVGAVDHPNNSASIQVPSHRAFRR